MFQSCFKVPGHGSKSAITYGVLADWLAPSRATSDGCRPVLLAIGRASLALNRMNTGKPVPPRSRARAGAGSGSRGSGAAKMPVLPV